jgi:hypothetical protein
MSESGKTQKEIDAMVVSQADDDSAWEPAIHVHPSRKWLLRPSSVDLAARHFVLSALHLFGARVATTWGAADVDLALLDAFGNAKATVEVKAVVGAPRWRVEDVQARENHFLVFVCYLEQHPHTAPDVYVLRSIALRNALVHSHSTEVELPELDAQLHGRDAWNELVGSDAAV